MSSFTSALIVSPLPDGRNWKLTRSFKYHVGKKYSKEIIYVPSGFITDFASTDILQWIGLVSIFIYMLFSNILPMWVGYVLLGLILLALLITPYGRQGKGAVLHDWLYHCQQIMDKPITRKRADQIFLEAMIVAKKSTWKALLMYYGVRLGGWFAWHRKRRKEATKAKGGRVIRCF